MNNQASAGASRSCVCEGKCKQGKHYDSDVEIYDFTGAVRLTILGKATKS